jgi:hypothetical protein
MIRVHHFKGRTGKGVFKPFWIIFGLSIISPILYRFIRKWILVPIGIHRTQTQAIQPDQEYATPEHITPEMREMLQTLLPQFRAEGFTAAANFHHRNAVPGIRAIQMLLVNRATNDVAVILAVWSSSGRSLSFAIRSIFEDQTSVATGVSRVVGIYPKDPDARSASFPWVKDAHTLCEIHRRRLAGFQCADRLRCAPAPGEELSFVNMEWTRSSERIVRTGYRYADPSTGVYRLTWKGAFLVTWKESSPIKDWRNAARDRGARREWKTLGMDNWSASASVTTMPPAIPIAPTTPVAAAQNNGEVGYEVALRADEIRAEVVDGVVTVRMGRPSVGQFLAASWLVLLSACAMIAMLALNLQFYFALGFFARRMGTSFPRPVFGATFFAILFLVILNLRRLIIGVRSLHGTVVVTASAAGISFRNAPAVKRHTGSIAREDLVRLIVAGSKKPRRKSLCVLVAREANGRKQLLFYSYDLKELSRVRTMLLQAMGIEGTMAAEFSAQAGAL